MTVVVPFAKRLPVGVFPKSRLCVLPHITSLCGATHKLSACEATHKVSVCGATHIASITKSTGRQDQIAHAAVSLAQGEPYRCHGAVCKATASWWCPKTKCGHHDAVGCDPPPAPAWSTHRTGTSRKADDSSKIWCERVARLNHNHAHRCFASLCAS